MTDRRGFSLIEVMVAAAILGMAATALFGLFSTSIVNLGRVQDIHQYQLAAEETMNRVLLLPSLPPGGSFGGAIDRLNAQWNVNVRPWVPSTLETRPEEAIMKIDVVISWAGRSGPRNIRLESVKYGPLAYAGYDFERAVQTIF